jgi:hypothetical protein
MHHGSTGNAVVPFQEVDQASANRRAKARHLSPVTLDVRHRSKIVLASLVDGFCLLSASMAQRRRTMQTAQFCARGPREAINTKRDLRKYLKTHLDHDDSERPFEMVSENLLEMGALSTDEYLHSSLADSRIHDTPELVLEMPQRPSPTPSPEPFAPVGDDHSNDPISPSSRMQTVARLHQTCQRAFGSTDALKFEFLEENGANSKYIQGRPRCRTDCRTQAKDAS